MSQPRVGLFKMPAEETTLFLSGCEVAPLVSSDAELNDFKNSTEQRKVYLSGPVTFDDIGRTGGCIPAQGWGPLVPPPWGDRGSPGGRRSGLGRNVPAGPTVNITATRCFWRH